jgi:demethylmenaquinone methyltransferase / 2-methoxy-6-polyprenyl-1,4-benzoquinol methylase
MTPTSLPNPPHPPLPEYYAEQGTRQAFLNDLFDQTASYYTRIDTAASLGSGSWYRRRALLAAGLQPGMQALDVACGTGLVTISAQQIAGPDGLVIGLDPSIGMLHEARNAGCNNLIRGVGDALPFADTSFDLISMGYALRHVADLTTTFKEYARLLKPAGVVLILELGPPRSKLFRAFAKCYIREVLGRLFHIVSGERAVGQALQYWWDTSEHCAQPETIMQTLAQAGFPTCTLHERFNGLLREYVAVKS